MSALNECLSDFSFCMYVILSWHNNYRRIFKHLHAPIYIVWKKRKYFFLSLNLMVIKKDEG